jgi:hypothetical protein
LPHAASSPAASDAREFVDGVMYDVKADVSENGYSQNSPLVLHSEDPCQVSQVP